MPIAGLSEDKVAAGQANKLVQIGAKVDHIARDAIPIVIQQQGVDIAVHPADHDQHRIFGDAGGSGARQASRAAKDGNAQAVQVDLVAIRQ